MLVKGATGDSQCLWNWETVCTAGQFTGIFFFLWREILVLLTAIFILISVIVFDTYSPNFWKWSEWISVRNCPANIISGSFEFIRSQGGRTAEGTNGFRFTRIPAAETTFWSGFCEVQTMPCHIWDEMLQLIVRLSREGRRQVYVTRIMVATQVVIGKILERAWQTGSPNQRPLGHHQRTSTPRKDRCLLFSGQDAIVFETSATDDNMSSLTSQDSSCLTEMDDLGCAGGRVRGTLMSVCRQ